MKTFAQIRLEAKKAALLAEKAEFEKYTSTIPAVQNALTRAIQSINQNLVQIQNQLDLFGVVVEAE